MRGAISGLSASRKLRILSNFAGLKKSQMLQQNVGNCKNFTEPLVSNDDVCMGNIVRRVIDHVTIEISNRSNGVHLYMHQSAIFGSKSANRTSFACRAQRKTRAEKETRGAWIIHHGRKIALDHKAPSEFPALDESPKAADLLIRLGQSDDANLSKTEVDAVAKSAGLNPRAELPHYLNLLSTRRLIDRS
jgi:hypothetical protein